MKNRWSDRESRSFVRRYANLWQWLTFITFLTAALPIAFLRELRKGNQAAVWSKLKGVIAGLTVPMTQPPSADLPGSG